MKIRGITIAEMEVQLRSFLSVCSKPLVVVLGPTASGKTKLAVEIAKQWNGEVINADSRQIYEDITVGNARTTAEEMKDIPHHLFGTFPLSKVITVAQYKRLAENLIRDIHRRNHLPILCGGTFLWIDAVVDNFQIPKSKPNLDLRKKLEQLSTAELLRQLEGCDVESAKAFASQKNRRTIIRALEIYESTGKPKSLQAKKGKRKYNVLKIAPLIERDEIYRRIDRRTKKQLENGIIPEVKGIIDRYGNGDLTQILSLGWPGLTSIGCKEVIPYLQGEITWDELLSKLQQHNRNFAKRQLTWLRKDSEIHWIYSSSS